MPLTRRAALATPLLATPLMATPIQAAAPMAGSAPPGFFRTRIGTVELTVLLDGGMQMANSFVPRFFPDADPAEFAALRAQGFVVEAGLPMPVGCYLVNTGRALVLIDAGGHPGFVPTTGRMLENLRASGYAPGQVDAVLLTHIHPEHALGIANDGQRVFANAEIVVSDADLAFWTDPAQEPRVPQGQVFIQAARRAIAPYQGRIRSFAMPAAGRELEVFPGFTALPAPGHTPGHVSYRVDAGEGQVVLVWGDVVHQAAIQLARPHWRVGIDVDAAMAVDSRRRTLQMLAAERMLVGGVHLPWPGLGRIVHQGEGFAYAARPWQLG